MLRSINRGSILTNRASVFPPSAEFFGLLKQFAGRSSIKWMRLNDAARSDYWTSIEGPQGDYNLKGAQLVILEESAYNSMIH